MGDRADLVAAVSPVVTTLADLGVRYYVGGSVASSAHGVPRGSVDADIVADLDASHVAPFVRRLEAGTTVLAKLEWFRLGGEVSDRQWSDVVGVLRILRSRADLSYLRRWAAALSVQDLLERALDEARGDEA
jgi:hypothetical protein